MLPFHKAIHEQVSQTDSLHILARGLGMHLAATHFIASNVNSDSIIIGLNISRPLATSLIWPTLQSLIHNVSDTTAPLLLPRFLSADYTVRDRVSVYNASGFVIATAAVLVHDLLHHTLPVDRVQGIVIFAADKIKERSNEHFALSLFRMKNKTAYIKAFSENPQALSRGFHAAEKLMRQIYVSTLCLWPRFHKKVRNSLQAHVPDLIDLSVEVTFRTSGLLASIRDTIFAILDDLRTVTHAIDFSEIYRATDTDENRNPSGKKILVPNFDDCVRRQLEGADIRATTKVRSLVSDLTTLRSLLKDVFELNSVQFYQRIVTIRHTMGHGNNWLVRKEAQRAVFMARSRVWIVRKASASEALDNENTAKDQMDENKNDPESFPQANIGPGTITIATLEPSPKWKALREVLEEIQSDVRTAGASADVNRVLILVREERRVFELRSVLKDGEESYLRKQFREIFPSVAARARGLPEGGPQKLQITMTQLALPEDKRRPTLPQLYGKKYKNDQKGNKSSERKQNNPNVQNDDDLIRQSLQEVFRVIPPSNHHEELEIVIWCAEWVDIQGRGHRVLDEFRPSFVILYNTDLSLVRQVEVYKALHPGRPVRMYILAYDDAVEEEQFRQSSSREKAAFKTLIRERATMTILENQEGKQPEIEFTQNLLKETEGRDSRRSRRGLGIDNDSRVTVKQESTNDLANGKHVLVDTRELRSALPMLLHQSSLKIIPITLEVGDFILSKNIGIERKSVPDLYGSFGSGRLFNQAEALCRHYKHPCLLIELDPTKSLSLTATSGGVPSEIVATSIVSKMVLLLQQFPNFRLLWAKGPHDAAELFSALKLNESEPDEKLAAGLGVDTKESNEEQYNAGPKALLRSLPGIDSQNLSMVMRKVKDVATLISMSKKQMTEILGSEGKAAVLYDFVNESPGEALAAL